MNRVDDDFIKSGWLRKQSQSLKIWQQRWFVLTRTNIKYYHSPNDTRASGSMAIENVEVLREDGIPFAKKKSSSSQIFYIKHPARTYAVSAESVSEAKAWMAAIFQQSTDANEEEETPETIQPTWEKTVDKFNQTAQASQDLFGESQGQAPVERQPSLQGPPEPRRGSRTRAPSTGAADLLDFNPAPSPQQPPQQQNATPSTLDDLLTGGPQQPQVTGQLQQQQQQQQQAPGPMAAPQTGDHKDAILSLFGTPNQGGLPNYYQQPQFTQQQQQPQFTQQQPFGQAAFGAPPAQQPFGQPFAQQQQQQQQFLQQQQQFGQQQRQQQASMPVLTPDKPGVRRQQQAAPQQQPNNPLDIDPFASLKFQ